MIPEIQTPRLRLVPATIALARAEIEDRTQFAELLGASVPENWPPEMLADALPFFLEQLGAHPDQPGWWGWYGILRQTENARNSTLVASGGFMGRAEDGFPEIGYSVLPQFYRRGYATEMMTALIAWAFAQPGTQGVVAEADKDNTPSVRLLEQRGFIVTGDGREPNHLRFLLSQ